MAQPVKKSPAMQETQVRSLAREDPRRRNWQPTPIFLPGKLHRQRNLEGYSPWSHKLLDMTEWLIQTHMPKWWGLHKIPEVGIWRASGLQNPWRYRRWYIQREHGSIASCPTPGPGHPFHLGVYLVLYHILFQETSKHKLFFWALRATLAN